MYAQDDIQNLTNRKDIVDQRGVRASPKVMSASPPGDAIVNTERFYKSSLKTMEKCTEIVESADIGHDCWKEAILAVSEQRLCNDTVIADKNVQAKILLRIGK